MKKYYVKNVQNIDNYLLLTLRPHKPKDSLRFYPGQYVTISFMVDGRPSPVRCFSMVSSPNNLDEVQFAMRVEGNFTQAVQKLVVGEEVRLQGPYGEFIIDPEQDRNIILLAAGIGITPFMSMLRYATEAKLSNPITLLYACRSQADIPFYDELIKLQKDNPHFRIAFFIKQGKTTAHPGVTLIRGRINEPLLHQVTNGQYEHFTYFICGPDYFRNGLERILSDEQVEPDRILKESFNQTSKSGGLFGFSIPRLTYVLSGLAMILLLAFIMGLDLSRNVSTASATQTPTATSPTVSTPVTTTPSTYDTQTITPVTSPSTSSRYQAPVSSVS